MWYLPHMFQHEERNNHACTNIFIAKTCVITTQDVFTLMPHIFSLVIDNIPLQGFTMMTFCDISPGSPC